MPISTRKPKRPVSDDPGDRALNELDLARMRRTPQVKIVRRALGLTQEEFAARYRVPLGTLRDWEQGRTEPDQTTQAYLRVIAAEPDRAAKALAGALHFGCISGAEDLRRSFLVQEAGRNYRSGIGSRIEGAAMAKDEKTSKPVASKASKQLSSASTSKAGKSVAASALSQAPAKKGGGKGKK